ncbi:MAG: hypothetical protein ACYTF1_14590 [Planctomycetota bacterium]|jgi:hypothetical protein
MAKRSAAMYFPNEAKLLSDDSSSIAQTEAEGGSKGTQNSLGDLDVMAVQTKIRNEPKHTVMLP